MKPKTETDQGTIQKIEKKTGGEDVRWRIQIGKIWGSYWGDGSQFEEGDHCIYEMMREEKEGKEFKTFQDISKLPSGSNAHKAQEEKDRKENIERPQKLACWKIASRLATHEADFETVKAITRKISDDVEEGNW